MASAKHQKISMYHDNKKEVGPGGGKPDPMGSMNPQPRDKSYDQGKAHPYDQFKVKLIFVNI
jgi:hypothetical protein